MEQPIPLGPFVLHRVVGRGGIGQVWAGEHVEQQFPVAVKVLTADRARRSAERSALEDEVRAVAALEHPGVVMVFDHGVVDARAAAASDGRLVGGSPYLVMELASGGDVRPRRGGLPWPLLRSLLLGLLDALAHAHARGVVHRDLKPANVLLCTEDDLRPGPKLTDFGIAWAVDRADMPAELIGTPRYMAPEQFLGRWRDFGPWTDLYGLGCVAWELASGRPPFIQRGARALAQAHTTGRLPSFGPVQPVPGGFESWLRILLEKDPRARFQRAADAAWALDQLDEPVRGAMVVDIDSSWTEANTITLDATLLGSGGGSGNDSQPTVILPEAELPPASEETGRDHVVPSHPVTWRREDPPTPVRLLGVGLSLYGVRTIPLVDREEERDTLWSVLGDVRARRRPRAVVLRGAAGTGKSRLVSWIGERAHELGAATMLSAYHSQLGGPGDGLARMVARHLRCVGLSGGALVERIRRAGVARDDRHAGALASLIEPEGAQVRFGDVEERHTAYRHLLEELGRERPVVVWLDDVQWGGEAIRFADWLLEQQVEAPILLLLTVQEEALAERPVEQAAVEALEGRPGVVRQPTRPLPPGEREALVRALLGLDSDLVARVADRTGGNPLFTVQLVGDWVQRRILVAGRDGFRLRPGADASLPDDLHAVWSTHIDRLARDLGEEAVVPLELAAALGQDVDRAEWRAACEAAGAEVPADLVDALVARRLATPADSGFAFAHGMLRESLARLARTGGRWARHNAACAEAVRDDPERLGRHLLEAGQLEESLAGLLEGAAARHRKGEHREALWLLGQRERALEALGVPRSDVRWGGGWLLRARVHGSLHEDGLSEQEARRVESAARRHGWDALLPRALDLLAHVASGRGDLPRAESLGQAAQAAYEEVGDASRAAYALRELGRISTLAGDLDRALARTDEARARFEALADEEGIALTVNLLGDIARLRRDWEASARHFEHALALHRAAGRRGLEALTLHGLAEVQRLRGDLDEAELGYRACIAMDEGLGKDHSITRLNLGLCLLARGRYTEARDRLDEVRVEWERKGRRGYLAAVFVDLLPALAGSGQWTRFDHLLEESRHLLTETGMVDVDIAWPAELAGELAQQAGHPERARRAFAIALDQWEALKDSGKVAVVRAALEALPLA